MRPYKKMNREGSPTEPNKLNKQIQVNKKQLESGLQVLNLTFNIQNLM